MTNKTVNPLAIFLVGAVIIASLLAGLGLYIYRANGSYALDLSRPDYNGKRQEIKHTSDNERPKVTKDGAVNADLVKELNASFEFYLKQIGDDAFSERALSDEALGLPSLSDPAPTPVE